MLREKINFIKRNYIVGYSLILITVIAGVIFAGNYYSLNNFEENTDKLLQSKAVLAEDIFGVMVSEEIESKNIDLINDKISKIKETDSEIKKIEVLIPKNNNEIYQIIASSSPENIGSEIDNELAQMAFSNDSGIAFLNSDDSERYWEIIKSIKNKEGKRVGIVSFQMSLVEHDNFINASIKKVYIVLSLLMLLVLLVIANHVRFFRYALRATKLEEVDKMKDDFISMASHELKSPLTSIRGYVEILKDRMGDKAFGGDEDKKILENIDASSVRLNDLVIDLLDVSRIEQNRMPLEMKDIRLKGIIESAIREVSINAKNKNLELECDNLNSLGNIFADEKRVKQILINLLSNAIKYTPKGKVEVKVKTDDKNTFITIADTGLGMSANDLKNLFSKFYRIKTNATSGISGTGLGLWISKEIAKKMKGDITVESIEGVGSHFTLVLKNHQ